MAQRLIELGNGLELWKVHPSELREQDLNARSMTKETFDRLSATIRRDGRLESLPLVAKTDRGLEVVSGHHRLRAAINAELTEMFVIVDVTGLSRDQIAAKQLAHNSITGDDDDATVRQIYNAIKDAESRLEAFIKIDTKGILAAVKVHDIALNIDYKQVMMLFLPSNREQFEKIIDELPRKIEALYVADVERFEQFKAMIDRMHREYDIRSAGTAIAKMCDIVNESLGEAPNYDDAIAIRDVFKAAYLPKPVADRIQRALESMKRNKQIDKQLWRALDQWAAETLGEHAEATTA